MDTRKHSVAFGSQGGNGITEKPIVTMQGAVAREPCDVQISTGDISAPSNEKVPNGTPGKMDSSTKSMVYGSQGQIIHNTSNT